MQKGLVLRDSTDFDYAVHFKALVDVWQQGERLLFSGVIKKHTKHAVYINDGYYLKAVCEFKVR